MSYESDPAAFLPIGTSRRQGIGPCPIKQHTLRVLNIKYHTGDARSAAGHTLQSMFVSKNATGEASGLAG